MKAYRERQIKNNAEEYRSKEAMRRKNRYSNNNNFKFTPRKQNL